VQPKKVELPQAIAFSSQKGVTVTNKPSTTSGVVVFLGDLAHEIHKQPDEEYKFGVEKISLSNMVSVKDKPAITVMEAHYGLESGLNRHFICLDIVVPGRTKS